MEINSFSGDHAFLSNFYPCAVSFDGDTYPSVEHAYVAAKTLDREIRKQIKVVPTAGKVKRLGRSLPLRPGWDEMRIKIMRHLLVSKFKHAELRQLLIATGDAKLVEGNHWGDRFWGVCEGQGKNHLGELLMLIRAQVRTNSLF